eukprot:scaffold75836_cov51-Attheya_sp.AAC.2
METGSDHPALGSTGVFVFVLVDADALLTFRMLRREKCPLHAKGVYCVEWPCECAAFPVGALPWYRVRPSLSCAPVTIPGHPPVSTVPPLDCTNTKSTE